MYVELVTRVAVQEPMEYSLMRETLTSLHTLFDRTRIILRAHGPTVRARFLKTFEKKRPKAARAFSTHKR